jgi:hypothetical protein
MGLLIPHSSSPAGCLLAAHHAEFPGLPLHHLSRSSLQQGIPFSGMAIEILNAVGDGDFLLTGVR